MTYTVQTLDGSAWVSAWTDDDRPTTFPTRAHALDALAELMDATDERAEDYRVVEE